MRDKNGFTLIELLAILVILGIIATISVINIGKQADMNDDNNKKILNQKIENAAKIYAAKYYSSRILSGVGDIRFTLNDLINDGVLYLSDSQCTNERNTIIDYKRVVLNAGDDRTVRKRLYNVLGRRTTDCYQQEED